MSCSTQLPVAEGPLELEVSPRAGPDVIRLADREWATRAQRTMARGTEH